MKKLLFAALLLFVSLAARGQAPDPPPAKVDSLKEFRYQYKGQPFPYDSGVSVSDRQYTYLFKMSIYNQIEQRAEDALKPVPRIVYETKVVRKKGDGNKWLWGGGGTLVGLIFGFVIKK